MAGKARKKAVVRFRLGLYPEAAVKAAAKEYASVADVQLRREGGYIKAVIVPKPGPQDGSLADEFSNRVLFNSI